MWGPFQLSGLSVSSNWSRRFGPPPLQVLSFVLRTFEDWCTFLLQFVGKSDGWNWTLHRCPVLQRTALLIVVKTLGSLKIGNGVELVRILSFRHGRWRQPKTFVWADEAIWLVLETPGICEPVVGRLNIFFIGKEEASASPIVSFPGSDYWWLCCYLSLYYGCSFPGPRALVGSYGIMLRVQRTCGMEIDSRSWWWSYSCRSNVTETSVRCGLIHKIRDKSMVCVSGRCGCWYNIPLGFLLSRVHRNWCIQVSLCCWSIG